MSDEQGENKILKFKKEIARLKRNLKEQRYGLVWLDVPEAFEDDVENKLPILKEVPELAIKNNDGKPTHILIEGDNYHTLTCLNYTHKGKIDVIYIDPPYNTGSDGFRYKDKRIIDKFPDGTEVPKGHPFRHSYWLSFMRKRLELARDLLKDTGIILINIGDDEMAQLKILCDEIFGEKNFVANIIWNKTDTNRKGSQYIKVKHEYLLCYLKKNGFREENWSINKEMSETLSFSNPDNDPRGEWFSANVCSDNYIEGAKKCFKIKSPSGKIWERKWFKEKEEILKLIQENRIYFGHNGNNVPRLKLFKTEWENLQTFVASVWDDVGGFSDAKKEYESIMGSAIPFETPKPLKMVKRICTMCTKKIVNPIILDFFAGSGTTGHAVLELNKSNNLNQQFILCTNNENNIMTEVCYPRIKKVIQGYKNQNGKKIKGLGNSLKYYKTAFIGKNNILNATDEDKVKLAYNAGELLALAENTLELVKQNKYYQLFEDTSNEKFTAVYFREELNKFEEFTKMVKRLKNKTTIYVFSWGDEEFSDDFAHLKDVKVKTIPQPILEIYKNIYNLGV